MGGKKEKPSLFRTALQRLSFRSRKKKCSLVREQRQGADASADSTLIETEEVETIKSKSEVEADDTKSVPAPPNCSKINEVGEKSKLIQLKESNLSIDTASLATEKDTIVEEQKKVARSQSMTGGKIQVSSCLDNR